MLLLIGTQEEVENLINDDMISCPGNAGKIVNCPEPSDCIDCTLKHLPVKIVYTDQL